MKPNIYYKPFKHLKKDKVMEFLINLFGDKIDIKDRYFSNYAKAIAELIIEQQISFKVAISIKKKFGHDPLLINLKDLFFSSILK